MRFSEHEMVFFNSITKGNEVFGIPLQFVPEHDRKTEVQKTLRGLVKKGVLDSETKLSPRGLLPARALECYKECEKHLIINYLHIGLLPTKEAIVIIPLKNREYEMMRIPRTAVLYKLLEQYPILREKGKNITTEAEKEEPDTFLKELKQYDGNIMAGEFEKGKVQQEQVYFWKDSELYQYDLKSEIRREISPARLRRKLIRMLEIREETAGYER